MKLMAWVSTVTALLMTVALTGCSEDSNPAEAKDKLCDGASGLGARVSGRAAPIDVCVPDDHPSGGADKEVITSFTAQNRYDVTARMTAADGTIFEIQMIFPHQDQVPKALNLTGNLAQASGDPDGAWFYYQEIPPTGDPVESTAVTAGTFTLSFSDTDIAAGTFAGVSLEIENANTNEAAGTRSISEGFFSISVDS